MTVVLLLDQLSGAVAAHRVPVALVLLAMITYFFVVAHFDRAALIAEDEAAVLEALRRDGPILSARRVEQAARQILGRGLHQIGGIWIILQRLESTGQVMSAFDESGPPDRPRHRRYWLPRSAHLDQAE